MSRNSRAFGLVAIMALIAIWPSFGLTGSVLVSNPSWQFIGPRPIQGAQSNFGGTIVHPEVTFAVTGRVTSIAVDPTGGGTCGPGGTAGACRIFVGTAGGGLWMTSDGGNSFTNISGILDPSETSKGTFPQTTVGSVALNPNISPPTLYLATGEGNQGDSFWGDGIFTSANLGSNWSQASSVHLYNGLNQPTNYGEGFTKIAVDPTHSPAYVYVAATSTTGINRAGLPGFSETSPGLWGIWRSTDGGSTFTQYSASQMGGCSSNGNSSIPCRGDDVVIDPSTNYVYAAVHDGNYGSGTYAVMRSTDSGTTWSALFIPGLSAPTGRFSLAASSGTVYVMVGWPDNVTYLGFFKSTNSGAAGSWTTQTVPCVGLSNNTVVIDGTTASNLSASFCGLAYTSSQSFYDQALAIQPGSGGNTVAFGGVGTYISTNSGATWNFLGATGGLHADVHALQFDPFNSNSLYVGTDGGLFRINVSNPGSPTINALTGSGANTIVAAQLYNIGLHPIGTSSPSVDAQTFLTGLQDNGTTLSSPSPTSQPTPNVQWPEVETADGSFALFDSQNGAYAYHDWPTRASVTPWPRYSTTGGGAGSWSTSPFTLSQGDLGAQFFAPLAVDPTASQFVLLGSFYTYASSNDMQSWTQQTTQDLTRGCFYNQPPGYSSSSPCAVTDLSFAPSDHTKGYAVTGIANVYSSSSPGGFYVWHTVEANLTSGTTWNEITGNLRNNNNEQSYVIEPGGLTVDPNNAAEVYLGLQCSPLFLGNCVSSLYKATPNGSSTTWAPVDGSAKGTAPINGPVYKVLVDNTDTTSKHLLAGTAAGLFMSSDAGADWTPYNGGGAVPNVPVLDIEQNSAGQVFVATHGAGAYKLAVPFYVGRSSAEAGESGCPNPCTINIAPPSGAQPGDVFLLVLQALENPQSSQAPPSGLGDWTPMLFANQGYAQTITSSDQYHTTASWAFAHVFSSGDPASYSFTLTPTTLTEFEAYLFSYRGASQDFSAYTLYGYPTTADSTTVSVSQLNNAPSGMTLLNIFQAQEYDASDDSSTKVTFQAPAGSPSLTVETPLSAAFSTTPYLVADIFTGPTGGTFGTPAGYSTSDGFDGSNTGFQILVPPL